MDEKKEKHTFLNIIIFVILLIAGIFLYAKYVGVKGIKTKEYRVVSEVLPSNFSGLKIVHFSDLLYKSTINKNDVKSLVEKINILKPDIVVFTGDLVDINTKITEDDVNYLSDNLSLIEATIGKYAIYGDYDFSFNEYEEVMEKANFKMLYNSYEEIFYNSNDSIYLVGLPSSIKEKSDLSKAFEFYDENDSKYIITLIHDGKTMKELNSSDIEINLVLGGHSLNGTVVLPYYGGLFIDNDCYKYYKEYYKKGITDIYISSGLGTNKYQLRFNNKPSFNLYRLKAQS